MPGCFPLRLRGRLQRKRQFHGQRVGRCPFRIDLLLAFDLVRSVVRARPSGGHGAAAQPQRGLLGDLRPDLFAARCDIPALAAGAKLQSPLTDRPQGETRRTKLRCQSWCVFFASKLDAYRDGRSPRILQPPGAARMAVVADCRRCRAANPPAAFRPLDRSKRRMDRCYTSGSAEPRTWWAWRKGVPS